jgi:hypothetical protein
MTRGVNPLWSHVITRPRSRDIGKKVPNGKNIGKKVLLRKMFITFKDLSEDSEHRYEGPRFLGYLWTRVFKQTDLVATPLKSFGMMRRDDVF